MMWLKIDFDEEDIVSWSTNPKNIVVNIVNSSTAPINTNGKTFRISPIFPLLKECTNYEVTNTTVHFFNFSNAYRVLGRIKIKGSDELKNSTFFSLGLASVILITNTDTVLTEFRRVIATIEAAYESWIIENNLIVDIAYDIKTIQKLEHSIEILQYDVLPVTERALIDEFYITINLLLPKLAAHMTPELTKINLLIEEVNSLISELVYLYEPNEACPASLSEYEIDELKGQKLNHIIRHQNLDRIVQINSALSYVATQTFSGAIPILERRSIVRRNSLLGVGSGILALNNIARVIERSFSRVSFDDIIIKFMSTAKPLTGTSTPLYDSSDWEQGAINVFSDRVGEETPYYKFPYFSGRLGFRETEYSIAAAIQTLTSGASLEWSLLTLTHEMLHGHVRKIISAIFFGDDQHNPDQLRKIFYSNFDKHCKNKHFNESLTDSVRNVILSYCCFTITHGSISVRLPYTSNDFKIVLPPENELWNIVENENRNISEIFVHVLDLHYFYGSRISIYIPLIWCSWVSIPHINGDIRQYVLRSLLAISSKLDGDPFTRFNNSVSRLRSLLIRYENGKLNYPIIRHIIGILEDFNKVNEQYFPAFKASLIIVDLVTKIFISSTVRSSLFNDEFILMKDDETDEESFENNFEYRLPSGFNDDIISAPLAYLLDRMTKLINSNERAIDLERDTTLMFMALNSN